MVGLIEDTVTVKATVPYTGGQAGYNATFTAVVKTGSIKGDSFTEPIGIIVGDYGVSKQDTATPSVDELRGSASVPSLFF